VALQPVPDRIIAVVEIVSARIVGCRQSIQRIIGVVDGHIRLDHASWQGYSSIRTAWNGASILRAAPEWNPIMQCCLCLRNTNPKENIRINPFIAFT
jgi:hypothetical protein